MAKTSISALQEFIQKSHGSIPRYTDIPFDYGETPHFIIRCECMGLSADGAASNKKTAKQCAAGNMIKLLNEKYNYTIIHEELKFLAPSSPAVQKIITPTEVACASPGSVINHIGKLNELCAIRKMQQPVYLEKSSTGPSHRPLFTVECLIGNLSVSATALTKKQAKQEAAGAMRELLKSKGIIPNEFASTAIESGEESPAVDDLVLNIESLKISEDPKVATATARARELYPTLNKRLPRSTDTPKNMLMANYSEAFRAYFDPNAIEKFHEYYKCLEITEKLSRASLVFILERISDILKITWERYPMKTKNINSYLVLYHIKSKPSFTEAGIGDNSEAADIDALHRLIGAIYILLV
ncbi:uncharacterized protein [Fopius arisanus]|uniref:Stau2_0 protein n=1 Tax=Fopius arisanus TaxID=64838 RepID=A0A0C9REM9_9HYME|nr:PREDICTED: uncharacterized protein LOC105269531 [Fopius arisanus]XP_011308160.1 PREDICTED: uncharacterized protein LOC105269531 [Fopius arisanus]XP_011308162.1 PREDICTED: uncharacterized protein LOC105269531 [Fopius arisanus]